MLDELLCMQNNGDKKGFSISKILSRLTYFGAGFGVSMLVRTLTDE